MRGAQSEEVASATPRRSGMRAASKRGLVTPSFILFLCRNYNMIEYYMADFETPTPLEGSPSWYLKQSRILSCSHKVKNFLFI